LSNEKTIALAQKVLGAAGVRHVPLNAACNGVWACESRMNKHSGLSGKRLAVDANAEKAHSGMSHSGVSIYHSTVGSLPGLFGVFVQSSSMGVSTMNGGRRQMKSSSERLCLESNVEIRIMRASSGRHRHPNSRNRKGARTVRAARSTASDPFEM
jgi:hypothetical protein